jgi:hypothetical protein
MKVEWEITMKCNYSCSYCSNLDKSIYPNLDRTAIREFIKMLGEQYPGVEIFVFGGEPFVHPEIGYIIQCFNELNVPFVIQTNLSKHSVSIMKTIDQPFTLQASIHPTEIVLGDLADMFDHTAKIRIIDVMYGASNALYYYFKVKELSGCENTFLTPVTDFGDGRSNALLEEYLNLARDPRLQNIIKFESVQKFGKPRAELWADIKFSPKGKPCLYNGEYFLYGPDFQLYNCCYREKHDGICNHSKCFLM